jgi:hypothetical protein
LDSGKSVQLGGELTVDILNVPIDGLDQAQSAFGAGRRSRSTLNAGGATLSGWSSLTDVSTLTDVSSRAA